MFVDVVVETTEWVCACVA